ncbi:MAG TPA: O-antigen ligase family protein [Noviherbaspirillum sp.]|nr:O-antigen ligase family protein [Noviherbaspirillum sp.]
MIFPFTSSSLAQARVWIFTAICFVLPMKASFIYVLSALLLLVWIAEGRWLEKIEEVLRSKLCLAFIAYYCVYVLAMLWTENAAAGWHMVDRQIPILLFLLFWSSAEPQYRERYISSFLAGLSVCAVLAHYNWIQLHWFPDWPRGVRVFKGAEDTAPFVDWIMYTPILALGTYFSLHRVVFEVDMRSRVLAIGLTILFLSNLAFSGGRAGMVMFAALCIALVFERIKARGKALLICVVLLPIIFFATYSTQSHFANRVDNAVNNIRTFQEDPNTSAGLRIVFWATSFQLFLQNPVLGVGSGDFTEEYARIKPAYWKGTPDTVNPHNQFLLTAATTGLLGLTALLSIIYFAAFSGNDMRIRSVLIGFAVVCMFESYLWRSNTALTFSAILAVLVAQPNSRNWNASKAMNPAIT